MKTSHTLPNGTILEVGKKYNSELWCKEDSIIFTEILFLGNKKAFLRNNEDEEYDCYYSGLQDLIPYEEPKPKLLEELKPYLLLHKYYKGVEGRIRFFDVGRYEEMKQQVSGTTSKIYTIEEAKELGLDLSMFNI